MLIPRRSVSLQALKAPFSVALVLAAAGLPCAAQPIPAVTTFVYPNATSSGAYCVTPDGNIVGGFSYVANFPSELPVVWNRQTGITGFPLIPGGTFACITGLSVNASVAVGSGNAPGGQLHAARWSAGSTFDLGVVHAASDHRVAVSRDGLVIAAMGGVTPPGYPEAFRWTLATGRVNLGYWGSAPYNTWANALSADGSVAVGAGSPAQNPNNLPVHAARWQDGIPQDLGVPAGWTHAFAHAVSPSGDVIVGRLVRPTAPTEGAFRWTATAGLAEIQFLLPGATGGYAEACTPDGHVVVGRNYTPGGQRATIWTPAGGVRDLTVMLRSMGAMPQDAEFTLARAISDDGTVIVGSSYRGYGCQGCERAMVVDFRGDSDGDGLLDHWEINGIPYINDLGQAKRLHLPGADPAHKDLYLEIDAMAGMSIPQESIDLVVQAFADAPLANPDGTNGVLLHVLVDEPDLEHRPLWVTSPDNCWPADFSTYYSAHFGTDAERAANGGPGSLFEAAKAKAYRYCIIADAAAPKDWGGCGLTPGDKSVIFVGHMTGAIDKAAALMHELGHNLGLHHGGNQSIQGKPNYPSIMNYALAYRAEWNDLFWRLDYSREGALQLGNLNEASLDETRGIGASNSLYAEFLMPIGVNDATGRTIKFVWLDGSPFDYGDAAGTGIPDGNFTTGVAQDLNFLPAPPPEIFLPATASPGESLTAHNDWANVILPTPAAIGPGAPLGIPPTDELTISAKNWISQNWHLPGGPQPCYANCDGSTGTPILNALDFQCFINQFAALAPYANCDGSTGAPVLNALDFQCFINQFAAGCT